MNTKEKIHCIENQIKDQYRLIHILESSEQLDFHRTPSSWSVSTLRDRSAVIDTINQLQIAKKDLILISEGCIYE